MKKITSALLIFALIITTTVSVVFAEETNLQGNAAKEFYVSENGNDANDGSREHPFRTIEKAKETVASISDSVSGDIVVNIAGGTYRIYDTLDFTNADSGKNGHMIIYRGDKDDKPVISGGRVVEGFKESADYPGLLEAYLPGYEKYGIRELYVNDVKRFVAKSERYITAVGNYSDPTTKKSSDGMIVSKDDIPKYDNPEDVQQTDFVWYSMWKKSMCNPVSIEENPDNADTMIVRLSEELNDDFAGSKVQFQIENCMGVLDSPGEFYYNERTSMLYYMPYEDEKAANTEFVVPNLEFCMFFIGDGVSYPVKNITIENIKFEHFTRLYNDNYYSVTQADIGLMRNRSAIFGNTRGAVYLMRADNINFINNVFCNLGDSAINLYTAVSNCKIEGNSFYDLGGSALKVGTSFDNKTENSNIDFTPEKNPKTDYLLTHMSPYISASNSDGLSYLHEINPNTSSCYGIVFDKTSVQDLYMYKKGSKPVGAWKSGDVKEGEKAFVLYDFAKAYSFSEIDLCFNPEFVTPSEKSNYEILLSNDEEFSEGNYVTVAVQKNPADEIAKYKMDTTEKYRYLMVRKLDGSPFALSFLYPFSKDYPHDILMKRCENITVDNNCITRVSDEWMGDPAITAKTGNNVVISNNEITDVPYTGISAGWGWNSSLKHGWFTITNNIIHNTNGTFYDGGCIYIFGGCHVGDNRSFIANNWLKAYRGRALYNDEGCMGVDMTDNVIEFVPSPMFPNNGAKDNTLGNTYSTIPVLTTTTSLSNWNNAYKSVGPLTVYTLGDNTADSYRIKSEAGLSKDYAYLRDSIPDRIPRYDVWGVYSRNDTMSARFVRDDHTALIDTLQYTLKNGKFGDGYGMYPTHIKAELEDAVSNKYKDFESGEKVLELRSFAEYVERSFKRVGYEQMLKACEDKLDKTQSVASVKDADPSCDTVLNAAKDEFKTEIERIKAKGENADKYELFELTKELENAYNKLCENIIEPSVAEVYSESLTDADIDRDNRTVSLKMPRYAADTAKVNFGATQNGLLTNDFGKISFDSALQLPLYSKNTGKYSMWTVNVQESAKNYGDITADGFSSYAEKLGAAKDILADGGISYENLQGEFCWYLNNDVKASEENEFRFSVKNNRELNNVTFILGAETLTDFSRNSKLERHDRIELTFKNSMVYVYTVKGGVRKLNYSGVSGMDYKNVNTVKYKITPCDGYSVLNLTVNGKTYDIACSETVSGTAFGFYSDSLPIVLY